MVGEVIERKLYDLTSKGDVTTLVHLLREDPYLVHGVSFPCSRNLLHIAAIHGQTAIVDEVLKLNPRLARISDTQKSSPLHIAAEEGHVEICQKLLSVAPEACWWRDCHDMNPLHIAVMKGHVEIVLLLLQESIFPAMEKLRWGETVLHLCVKHGQHTVFKVLVERLGTELVYAADENGETIMHLAVRCNQLETLQCLVESNKIEKGPPNSMAKTPIEILDESPPDTTSNYLEFRIILSRMSGRPSITNILSLPKLTESTMVVAVLIATMAFQTTVNPPGGVWQDDTPQHKAGDAIKAYTRPNECQRLITYNTIAFLSSMGTIISIIVGLPLLNSFCLAMTLCAAGFSIISLQMSYEASKWLTNPNTEGKTIDFTTLTVFIVISVIIVVGMGFKKVIWLYVHWKRLRRQEEDLATDPLPKRILYRIFQCLES